MAAVKSARAASVSEISEAPADMFRLIGNDEVALIMRYLVRIPDGSDDTLRLRKQRAAQHYAALCGTCKYMRAVLSNADPMLDAELHARRICDVSPRALESAYAHAEQAQDMAQEMVLIRTLRKGETNLCFHCAGKHCRDARVEVERKVQLSMSKASCNCRVHAITNSRVYNVSVCEDDSTAWVAARTYDSERRARDVIQRFTYHGKSIDNDQLVVSSISPHASEQIDCSPNLMAAHSKGHCCAWTCEVETYEHAGNEQGNALYVTSGASAIQVSPAAAKVFDQVEDMPGCCHAQGIWWRGDQLCVAWSTTLVAGSGHDMHGGAPVTPDERFVIGSYHYDKTTLELLVDDFCGPYYGRLMTTKATRDGCTVACHIRCRPLHRWDMHYRAMVVDVNSGMAECAHHPTIWKHKGKRRQGKDGFDWGPSAVGISPAGDALVCIHRTAGGVCMEVLDQSADPLKYLTTNSRDLTEYFTTGSYGVDGFEDLFESESSSDSESEDDYPNKVKLPFDIDFTASGSHACLVDRRPQFGSRAPRYSTVLVDLTKRRQVKLMKALALFQERGSAAKGLHWQSRDRVWVQGRRGLMCVSIE